jgi:molybdate transport system substrate-binding protein
VRLAAAFAVAVTIAGCGDDGRLRVSAATSLKAALAAHAGEQVSLSFGGSDQLAAQIRRGVEPDVFAAANVELADALHREGLTEAPVVFATNRLVLAVPAQDARVRGLEDLERPGVRLAVGARGVPAGDYARRVLTARAARNVRSEEPDVAGVVGKVAQGAVDAGFVYATDVRASGGRLRAIDVPGAPPVRYAAVVVKPSERARAFVEGLKGAPSLRAAGFGTP